MELIAPIDVAKESVLRVQEYSQLAWRSITNIFAHPRYLSDTLQQADSIGVGSVPVVVLTGLFTGMVLALQGYYGLRKFGGESMLGAGVALSMTRELGPVLTAVMVAAQAATEPIV